MHRRTGVPRVHRLVSDTRITWAQIEPDTMFGWTWDVLGQISGGGGICLTVDFNQYLTQELEQFKRFFFLFFFRRLYPLEDTRRKYNHLFPKVSPQNPSPTLKRFGKNVRWCKWRPRQWNYPLHCSFQQHPKTWEQLMMTSLWSLISRSDLDQRYES